MKLKSILSLLFTICSLAIFAQAGFEGTIKAKVEAIKVPDQMKGYESMLNQTVSTTVKGDRTKAEMKGAMQTVVIISDYAKKEVVMLMDMMGQKIAVADKMEDGDHSNTPMDFNFEGGKVELTNETKMIAGYKCKKAIFTSGDPENNFKTDIWYTEDIAYGTEGAPVPGMLMEFEINTEGMIMRYTVTEITKGSVPESTFEIPAGYTKKTPEEMQKMFPQMGGGEH